MHKLFSEWYRVVSLTPNAQTLESRWDAIEVMIGSMGVKDICELVRLFFSSPLSNAQFLEGFRASFQKTDRTFLMRGNDLELRVLGGSALVGFFEKERSELGDVAALAMVSVDFRGLRASSALPELVDRARTYLTQRSASLRSNYEAPPITISEVNLESHLEALKQAGATNLQNLSTQLILPLTEIASTVNQLLVWNKSAISQLVQSNRLRQEESNILWWLFGEYSRDLNGRMAELTLPAACLVAGKELSDLTVVLPGPLPSRTFLERMLRLVEPTLRASTSLLEAIDESPVEWRTNWISKRDISHFEDLCPAHQAAKKSLDTTKKKAWVPAFEKTVRIKAGKPISPVNLALQVYEENLLAEALIRTASTQL